MTRDVWQTALLPDVSVIAVDARLFHEGGCRLVHRYCVYKDPFPHPALKGGGGGASLSAVIREPGYGHCPAYTATNFHPSVGGAPGPGTSRVFSGWHVVGGTDESTSSIICQ